MEDGRPSTSQGGSSSHALQCPPSTSSDTNHRSSPSPMPSSNLGTTHQNLGSSASQAPTHKLSSANSPTGSATSNVTSSSIAAPSPSIQNSNRPPPLDRDRLMAASCSGSIPSPSLTPTSSRSALSSIKSGFRFSKSSSTPALSRAKILSSLYANVPNRHKLIHVHTLTSENLPIAVESKCAVWDIFHTCCMHLSIEDDRFFGLAIRSPSEGIGGDKPRHEYFFLQFDQKISKYLPKQSRFGKSTSVDKHRPALVLYLRVRVYIERIDMIQCNSALMHYYKQLRENLLDHWSGSNSVSEERCWELAALALQADKNEETDEASYYFRAELYFPLWVINQRGLDYLRKNMPKVLNSDHSRLTQHEAMAISNFRSPFALNCHLYGLRRHKADVIDNALIGITDKGIDMWDVGQDGERIPLRNLAWNRMARLSFDKKRLSIGGLDGSKISLYSQTDEKARYLLDFCKDVHQQLLKINLHFALSRPPSTRTLPPGWGNELSVDGNGRLRCPLKSFEQNSIDSSNFSTTSGMVLEKPIDVRGVDFDKASTGTGKDSIQIPGSKATSSISIASSTVSKTSLASTTKSSMSEQVGKIRQVQIPSKIDTKKKATIKQEPSPTNGEILQNGPSMSSTTSATSMSDVTRMLENARSPQKLPLGMARLGTSEVGPEPEHEPQESRRSPPVSTLDEMTSVRPSLPTTSAPSMVRQAPPILKNVDAVMPIMSSPYGSSNSQGTTAMRRTHFGPSKTFDENPTLPSIAESPYSSVLVTSGASRSMHDLRSINAIKQPPEYHPILYTGPYQQEQSIYAHPQLPPHSSSQSGSHGRGHRWQTFAGDDDLAGWIHEVKIRQNEADYRALNPNEHLNYFEPPNPTMSKWAKSDPNINQLNPEVQAEMRIRLEKMVRQQEMANKANAQAQVEQQPKTKRRYASRSPARGAINRVKSMPSHSAMLVNELNQQYQDAPSQQQPQAQVYRNANALAYAQSMPQQPRPMMNHQLPHQPASIPMAPAPPIPTTMASGPMPQREPPSYQEAVVRMNEQVQAQVQGQLPAQVPIPTPPKSGTPPNGMNPMVSVNPAMTQKNLAKRASLDPVSMKENIQNYPMMSRLLHEMGGMPSSSSSDETVGAPVIPPKDYESPQYDTPPEELQEMMMGRETPPEQIQNWINMHRQPPQYFNQPYPIDYAMRYGPPIPVSQPMRTMANASPPSPPYYFKNPPMAGFMPTSGSPNRGEYIFQHNLSGPYVQQYNFNAMPPPTNGVRMVQQMSQERPSLTTQQPQGMMVQNQNQPVLGVQLPPPPPYPQKKVFV